MIGCDYRSVMDNYAVEEEAVQPSAKRARPSLESADVPHLLLEAHPPPADLNSPPPSPPDSASESDASETSETDDVSDVDDAELAGYEFCSREAIRYLLEEERLDRNHPVIRQLQQHLTPRRFQLLLNSGRPLIPDSAN